MGEAMAVPFVFDGIRERVLSLVKLHSGRGASHSGGHGCANRPLEAHEGGARGLGGGSWAIRGP